MADAPATLRAQQFALARHLRDPDGSPPPPGLEDRRLAVYRDLVFDNLDSLLGGNFPVIRRLLGDAWPPLVRAFLRDHRARTPLFPELPREFLRFVDGRTDVPPWLPELAHYEWIELALHVSEARIDDAPHVALDATDAPARLLDAPPVLSPLAWPLAYRWPVHRLRDDFRPEVPPAQPTLLLARRDGDGSVRFSELGALAFRLLQRLAETPEASGRAHLEALAAEAGARDVEAFVDDGRALLAQMHAAGVVLGIATRGR